MQMRTFGTFLTRLKAILRRNAASHTRLAYVSMIEDVEERVWEQLRICRACETVDELLSQQTEDQIRI